MGQYGQSSLTTNLIVRKHSLITWRKPARRVDLQSSEPPLTDRLFEQFNTFLTTSWIDARERDKPMRAVDYFLLFEVKRFDGEWEVFVDDTEVDDQQHRQIDPCQIHFLKQLCALWILIQFAQQSFNSLLLP